MTATRDADARHRRTHGREAASTPIPDVRQRVRRSRVLPAPAGRPLDGRAVLGANLKRFRLAREVSQEALADRAGLDRTYVAAVERAEVNVSIDNICRIAWALDRHPRDLLSALPTLAATLPGAATR